MIMTPHVTLTYTNSAGQSMGFNYFSSYICNRSEGIVPNQVHLSKQPGVHGHRTTGMSLDSRQKTLGGEVRQGISLAVAERTLHTIFNPTLGGVLRYQHSQEGADTWISCKLNEFPQVYWRQGRLRFDIDLVCPDPFWKGQSVREIIAVTRKMFTFPMKIPKKGVVFGLRRATLESTFENKGNVEGDFIATIRARNGTVTNPEIITALTGERVRILYTMRPDDVITIISSLQERTVLLNGANALHLLDVDVSQFFRIAVGTNVIRYSADENVSNIFMHVDYIPNYTFALGGGIA